MISKKVIDYLKKNKVPFALLDHKKVYTAFDAAQTLKVKLEHMVKSLIVKADKAYYLVSLPAHKNIEFALLKKAIAMTGGSVKKLEIPGEKVLTKVFKIKPGGLSAFGSMHKLKVILDKDLQKARDVVVSGGSLTQSMGMKLKDYLNLEKPFIAPVGKKRKLVVVLKKARSAPAKKSGARPRR